MPYWTTVEISRSQLLLLMVTKWSCQASQSHDFVLLEVEISTAKSNLTGTTLL